MTAAVASNSPSLVIPLKINNEIIARRQITKEESSSPLLAAAATTDPDEQQQVTVTSVDKRLDAIALLAHQITSSSDEADVSIFSNIQQLLAIIGESATTNGGGNNTLVIRAAYASLFEIFISLIPKERKIRERTDKELQQQMKQETKTTLKKESNLVKSYTQFIDKAFGFLKPKTKPKAIGGSCVQEHVESMRQLTFDGFCGLLRHNCQFNINEKILNYLLNFLNQPGKQSLKRAQRNAMIFATVSDILNQDSNNNLLCNTLLIVRTVNRIIKNNNFNNVANEILDLLFAFNIEYMHSSLEHVNLNETSKDNIVKQMNKNNRNVSKKSLKLSKKAMKRNKDLNLVKAKHDQTANKKYLVEITEIIFFIFFKYIKLIEYSDRNESKVILSLQGLARYSHLLNVDFFDELLELFKEILNDSKSHQTPSAKSPIRYSIPIKLQTLLTFFTILKKFSTSVIIDCTSLYRTLPQLLMQIDYALVCKSSPILEIIKQIVNCIYSADGLSSGGPASDLKILHQITTVLYNYSFLQSSLLFNECHKTIDNFLASTDLHDMLYLTGDNEGIAALPFTNLHASSQLTEYELKCLRNTSASAFSISLLNRLV